MALETSYASRNIGDIFYTLRKDGTLNGAVPTDGKEYSASDFDISDENNNPYMLCVNGQLPSLDYTKYAAEVKANGVCASFGIDVVNGKFKVPTLKNVFIEAGDVTTLARYLAPGLPDISGYFQASNQGGAAGAFAKTGGTDAGADWGGGYRGISVDFLASRSNAIYGRSSTVQPPAVLLRPMVQLMTVAGGSGDSSSDIPVNPDIPVQLRVPYIFVPGTEAKATEVNANFDYVLRAIEGSVDTNVVHYTGDEIITGRKTFTTAIQTNNIELFPGATAMHGGSIDFHFAGSEADYTSRLIESAKGHLSINQDPPKGDATTKIATTKWSRDNLLPTFYTSGTSWYVLYPNGWIRQGGEITLTGANVTNVRINFILEMKDLNFGLGIASEDVSGTTVNGTELGWGRLDTKGFYAARQGGYAGNQRMRWWVEGYKK